MSKKCAIIYCFVVWFSIISSCDAVEHTVYVYGSYSTGVFYPVSVGVTVGDNIIFQLYQSAFTSDENVRIVEASDVGTCKQSTDPDAFSASLSSTQTQAILKIKNAGTFYYFDTIGNRCAYGSHLIVYATDTTSSGESVGTTIGSIIGALILLGVCGFLYWWFVYKKRVHFCIYWNSNYNNQDQNNNNNNNNQNQNHNNNNNYNNQNYNNNSNNYNNQNNNNQNHHYYNQNNISTNINQHNSDGYNNQQSILEIPSSDDDRRNHDSNNNQLPILEIPSSDDDRRNHDSNNNQLPILEIPSSDDKRNYNYHNKQ